MATKGTQGGEGTNSTVFVSNLHEYVNEVMLKDIFSTIGPVAEVKILPDKIKGGMAGSGFVKFEDHRSVAVAVASINGRLLYTKEVRVSWAHNNAHRSDREDTTSHHQIFVGNLSSEVDDALLLSAFQAAGGVSDARVMLDHATQRSKGFGFVAFRDAAEAEKAIESMTGATIGQWKVRCGWAHHKAQQPKELSAEEIDAADPTNVNVYVGNLSPEVSEEQIRSFFAEYGTIEGVKQQKTGYAFVVFSKHADAVSAIVGRNGKVLGGKTLKCAWGRHQNRSNPAAEAPQTPSYSQQAGFGYAGMVPQGQQMAAYQLPQPGTYQQQAIHGYSMPTSHPQPAQGGQHTPMAYYGNGQGPYSQPALSNPQGPMMHTQQWLPAAQMHPQGQPQGQYGPLIGQMPMPSQAHHQSHQPAEQLGGNPGQYGAPQHGQAYGSYLPAFSTQSFSSAR